MKVPQQVLRAGVAQLVASVGTLLLSSFLILKLGKEKYAVFSMFFYIISLFLNFDNLPRVLSLILSEAKFRTKNAADMLGSAAYVALIFGVLIGILGATASWLTLHPALSDSQLLLITGTVFIYILIQTSNSVESAWMIWTGRPGDFQLVRAFSFMIAQLTFTAAIYNNKPLEIAFLAALVGPIFGRVLLRKIVSQGYPKSSLARRDSIYVRQIAKDVIAGVALGAAVISSSLADKLLIGTLSLEQVADYMLPADIIMRMCILHSILGYVAYSKMVQLGNGVGISWNSIGRYLRSTIIFFCSLAALAFIGAESIFSIWIGRQNASAEMIAVFQYGILVFVFNGFGWIGFNILSASGKNIIVAAVYSAIPLAILLLSRNVNGDLAPRSLMIIVTLSRTVDIILFFIALRSSPLSLSELFRIERGERGYTLINLLVISSIALIERMFSGADSVIVASVILATLVVFGLFYSKLKSEG